MKQVIPISIFLLVLGIGTYFSLNTLPLTIIKSCVRTAIHVHVKNMIISKQFKLLFLQFIKKAVVVTSSFPCPTLGHLAVDTLSTSQL